MRLKVLASGSKGNCYLLQSKNETLILECGIPYKEIIKGLNFNLRNVVGCLVSHEHMDHCKSIKDLINKGINIYTGLGTIDKLELSSYRTSMLLKLEQLRIGDFTILPFQTEHDAAEPLGFLIQHSDMGKLLFITDSYYCQYKFKGLNHIMIECNYASEILQKNIDQELIPCSLRNRLLKSHFSLANVKEFLKANDLSQIKEITLIHLSDGNSNAEQFKNEIERLTGKPVYIASKGLEIEL